MSSSLKIFIYLHILCAISLNAQNQSEESTLLQQNDKLIGIDNLSFTNGTIHINYDITKNKENHRYLVSNEYVKGTFTYKNQKYYDLLLNYDIYEDQLICIPNIENNYIKLNLIKKNIDDFKIDNKHFKNLNIVQKNNTITGFYEEKKINSSIILYIKHTKEKKEILQDQKVISEFNSAKNYIISLNNEFFKINTERDFHSIFPSKRNEINTFYKEYENLEKQNKEEFIIKLIKTINN
ncbi:MAG: hypothetical protein QM535_00095 [Limnohabitans sp.]|nr:hypothetical protein [Limnohabitans sp.]